MKKNILICTVLCAAFVAILGTFGHFFYEWSHQNHSVGLFFPTSESTWEHMKLFFFPALICYIILCFLKQNHKLCVVYAFPKSIFLGTFLIPTIFYTYSGILGFHVSFLDIATFYISDILSFVYLYKTTVSVKKLDYSLLWNILLIFMTFLFLCFSYNPPKLGIFEIPL